MNHDYQPQEIDEPEHTTRQQLSPASPRPQAVPSPSNIPILALSMDDNFQRHINSSVRAVRVAVAVAVAAADPEPLRINAVPRRCVQRRVRQLSERWRARW
jgi:hypothetical protein